MAWRYSVVPVPLSQEQKLKVKNRDFESWKDELVPERHLSLLIILDNDS